MAVFVGPDLSSVIGRDGGGGPVVAVGTNIGVFVEVVVENVIAG